MSENCLYLSEDTYVCTLYDNSHIESSFKKESQTDSKQEVKEVVISNDTATHSLCDQLDWFKPPDPLDPLDKNKRIRSTPNSCQAIYIPPEGPFTNFQDPDVVMDKHKKCKNTFAWYSEEKDSIFPSNGCLRHEYHTDILKQKSESPITQPPASPTATFQHGCYHCDVENNERGCIKQNKHYDNEVDATKACLNEEECSIIIKYTHKNESRFYLRRNTDYMLSDKKCMYKFVS